MVHETFDGRPPVTPDDDPDDEIRELVASIADRHDLDG
jgi:hypothetical protein